MDGEVDRRVDDRATGAQLARGVVDGEHGVLPVLGQHCRERAQPGRTRQQAGRVVEGDALMALEDEQDGALHADLLGVGSR
jgi:hypothetical protein